MNRLRAMSSVVSGRSDGADGADGAVDMEASGVDRITGQQPGDGERNPAAVSLRLGQPAATRGTRRPRADFPWPVHEDDISEKFGATKVRTTTSIGRQQEMISPFCRRRKGSLLGSWSPWIVERSLVAGICPTAVAFLPSASSNSGPSRFCLGTGEVDAQ